MKEIIDTIVNHVSKRGGKYHEWYCGIASSPRERLFEDHNVSEKFGRWIYKECQDAEIARDAEKYLIEKLGFDGGGGGGDDTTDCIYAYKKTATTVE